MSKRALGVFIQLIGIALWILLPVEIVPWKAILGIALVIIGGVIFRKAKKSETATGEKPKKTALEIFITATAVFICLVIIGILLMIVVPNFIKGYQKGRQQAIERQQQK